MRERLNCSNKVLLLICFCFLIACSKRPVKNNTKNIEKTNKSLKDTTTQKIEKRTVVIQPFNGTSPQLINSLSRKLKSIIPEVRLNEAIELPQSSYYAETNRYRADSLIRFLWNKSTYSSVVIGITEESISRASNGYRDFGIIGLAFKPGHSCIVSTHLFGGEKVEERLFKSALHELGHTQGLEHCNRKSYCYMKGAKNGKYPIDDLTGFCPYCKAYLEEKGWKL